jgi:hypothetical protein
VVLVESGVEVVVEVSVVVEVASSHGPIESS